MKILLLASGQGSLAQAIFDSKLKLEYVGLLSDKKSKALELAAERGIQAIYHPLVGERKIWDQELCKITEKLAPDLVVSVGFMRILSEQFVNDFRVINTHPAMLPLFPGAHAVPDALAAKVSSTGATIHWVDKGVDTGEVISQAKVDIEPGDDIDSLHERIKIVERKLIIDTLQRFIENGIPERT